MSFGFVRLLPRAGFLDPHGRPARRTRLKPRRSRRANLEPLEGRALLATLSVRSVVNASRLAGSEEEVAIAQNPANPLNLFAAAIPSGPGQVASVSTDGGLTWSTRIMSNGDGTPGACCDASMAFDTFGNLFMTYLSSSITTVVLMSTDGGQSFTTLADFGGSDQPTIVTGPGDVPGSQSVWVTYNRSGQIEARGARVTGLGQVGSFSAAQVAPDSGTGISGNFGDIVIGPSGEVAVAYQHAGSQQGPDTIFFNIDPDGLGPQGFGPRITLTSTNVGGFDFIPAQPRRSVDAEVGLAWDRSNGPHRGRLYAVYTDELPNESHDMDIFVRYSDNNGSTWSSPVRVNDDTGTNSQFLPKIALDQTTGNFAVVWFDARLDIGSGPGDTNGVANDEAIIFGTVSTNGGVSFEPNIQIGLGPSNSGIVANGSFDYGDYIGLAFHGGTFYPIWPDNSVQLPGNTSRPNFDMAVGIVDVVQLQVTATAFTATENTLFSGEVARFDPFNPTAQASDFTANIDWGDGGFSPGVIVPLGGGRFRVNGTHTYQEGGTYNVTITVQQTAGTSAFASRPVSVIDLPILGFPVTITQNQFGEPLKEGDRFIGQIASFTDTDPDLLPPEVYTAVIEWGDDGSSSLGIIVQVGPNEFSVEGDHVFGGGTSSINVTITGPGGTQVRVVSTSIAQDSPLDSIGFHIDPVEGTPFLTTAIARFTDEDPRNPPASNYFAQINWGDGSAPSVAIIQPDFINGGFLVFGNHVYEASADPYIITVVIGNRTGANTTTAVGSALVSDAPILVTPLSYTVAQGVSFTRFLATFTDTDPRLHPVSRYSAQIDWDINDGDNTTEAVEVRANTDGGYLVRGTHAYKNSGLITYRLTVRDIVGGGPGTTVEGTFNVPPSPLTIQIVTTASPQEGQKFNDVIATFTSGNPLAVAADFVANIGWGDGTFTNNAEIRRRADGVFEVLGGDKTYASVGSYTIFVEVTGDGNSVFTTGRINVADAPLTSQGNPLAVQSKTDLTNVLVASFTDGNPTSNLGDFTATINWGDGTPASNAAITQISSNEFQIFGDHRFNQPGTFVVQVNVFSRFGSTTTATANAVVSPRLFEITGGLDAASGPNAAQGITRLTEPILTGTAEPNARVKLFVLAPGQTTPTEIAQTTADASGRWTTTSAKLPDGTYTVQASAQDLQGFPSSALTTLLPAVQKGPMIVDTAGPNVSRVVVEPRTGRIHVTVRDSASGILTNSLANPSNYALSIIGNRVNRRLPLSGLQVDPPSSQSQQDVTLTFGGLGRLNRGRYVFEMTAPGLTDVAGNPLDERFFVPFPGLYTRSGQNFVAQFTTDGNSASPLQQYVPPPEVLAARRFQERINRLRIRRLRG